MTLVTCGRDVVLRPERMRCTAILAGQPTPSSALTRPETDRTAHPRGPCAYAHTHASIHVGVGTPPGRQTFSR